MSVVANSGPLIALSRIDQLELLERLYREVFIPRAVSQELKRGPKDAARAALESARWLRVREISDPSAVQILRLYLDQGESEAIVLACELKLMLLIDERRGRTIAASLGLRKTGTIGILLAAKAEGFIKEVTPLMDTMRAKKVRIAPHLYQEARKLAGEL